MEGQPRGRNYKMLGVVVLLAVTYGLWLYAQHSLTGSYRLDGVIGVLLGLFICSRPAANLLDLLFTRRHYTASAEWSAMGWLVLNVLVMIVGWIVITVGATHLIDRAV
jgi:hypothetical protein